MATEHADGINRDHFRAVTVTTIAAVFGIGAAVVSSVMTAGMDPSVAAKSQTAQLAVLGAIIVQPLLLKGIGMLKDDFGMKDVLFIAFMTFSMWFVTWGVILTTGVSF